MSNAVDRRGLEASRQTQLWRVGCKMETAASRWSHGNAPDPPATERWLRCHLYSPIPAMASASGASPTVKVVSDSLVVGPSRADVVRSRTVGAGWGAAGECLQRSSRFRMGLADARHRKL